MSRCKNSGYIDFQLHLNSVSWSVLHTLENEPSFAPWDEEKQEYLIECQTAAFYNGRERGFSLQVNHPARFATNFLFVVFAEQRNSDQVVVYTWTGRGSTNPPTHREVPEASWENQRCFDAVDKAADYIRELMKEFLAEEHKITVVKEVLTA